MSVDLPVSWIQEHMDTEVTVVVNDGVAEEEEVT